MKRSRHTILLGIVSALLVSCAHSGPVTLSLAASQSRTGEVRMNTDESFHEPAALPVEVDYSVRGVLPYQGDRILAWSIGRRKKPSSKLKKLAFSFGIVGTFEKLDDNSYLATDASSQQTVSLWVDDAGGWWNYQNFNQGGDASASSPGCAPDTECEVNPVVPEKPKNLIAPGDALRRTNQYLKRADMVPLNYPLEARRTDYSTEVFGALTLGGVSTNIGVTFSYGENGVLTSASGPLITIAMAGRYPIVSPMEAVKRLSDPKYGAIGDATRLAADVAVSSSPNTNSTESSRLEIVITGVRLLLMEARLSNGTHMLLPAYTFSNADGDVGTVVAITDELLAFRQSSTETTTNTSSPPDTAPLPEPVHLSQAEADGLIGLTEQEAVQTAESKGWIVRTAARDGEYFMLTSDYVTNRVNLTVKKTLVTSVAIG